MVETVKNGPSGAHGLFFMQTDEYYFFTVTTTVATAYYWLQYGVAMAGDSWMCFHSTESRETILSALYGLQFGDYTYNPWLVQFVFV